MAVAFKTRTASEWEALLDGLGVPASRVRSIGQLLDEGQPSARGLLHEVAVGERDTLVQLPGIGFRLNGDSLGPERPPHKVGQDDDRWLSRGSELGRDA